MQGLRRNFLTGMTSVGAASQAGVAIIAGSDAGNPATFHGPGLIHELELLAQAGLPLSEVLLAATSRPAALMGQDDLGTLAPGKRASFIVLDANPLDDIKNTRRIADVYVDGARLDRAALGRQFKRGRP